MSINEMKMIMHAPNVQLMLRLIKHNNLWKTLSGYFKRVAPANLGSVIDLSSRRVVLKVLEFCGV